MTEERFTQILDAFLGDADLMVLVNEAPSWEAGYRAAAEKIDGLTLDEWNTAMNMIRQAAIANAKKR